MGNIVHKVSPSVNIGIEDSGKVIVLSQEHRKYDIYQLVQPTNMKTKERGTLVEEAARCFKTKDYGPLHQKIRQELHPYLYNEGKGEDIPIKEIVQKRHQERQDKGKQIQQGFFSKLLPRSHSHLYSVTTDKEKAKKKRKCCWNITKRGALGETLLHICLLNNTTIHNKLAIEMVKVYPNLLHDIYLCDEYYGESALHTAIANENIDMIKFFITQGKKVNLNLEERCFGRFFMPQDQSMTRYDIADSDEVELAPNTNYKGLAYWGEYPLSFAVCSSQINVIDLFLRENVDILAQDTNGNNVLHMMVIHNNMKMFEYCYEAAGDKRRKLLEGHNKQGLTPLTLSAKLANKEMLDHILELKREVAWIFGDVTCAHYPLTDVDTIDPKEGKINSLSALSIILNAESTEHLSMLDGMLFQLLHEKWKEYAKIRFYQKAFFFIIYLVIFISAVFLQPAPPPNSAFTSCYLLAATDSQQIARFVLEILVVIGAILYLILMSVDIYNEGILTFWYSIMNAPSKASFHLSCVFIVLLVPCRFACSVVAENVILTLTIFTLIPYLFFFCRGFKLVGPFIVVIYNMIKGDLFQFLLIYLIFLLGFSQAMFIIFRGTEHPLFSYPSLSILGMFIITLGEFTDLYEDFDQTATPNAAKFLFIVYMVIATVLLINVLIAMMGSTFTKVADTRWEWQRQWAKIVLVIEQSVSPQHRRIKQTKYSLLDKGERWFVVRKFQTKKPVK